MLLGVNQYASIADAIDAALQGQKQSSTGDDRCFFEQDRVLTTPAWSAYTRIGEGCSNRCAFCAIPLIRGNYRSREKEAILGEVRQLAQSGVKEHILVAQDTTRYGTDWQRHSLLPELMAEVADIPGVDWLRVLYCYPDETDERLLDVIAGRDNICKYLDLPIQHINDRLLKAMRRRGDSRDIRRCLKGARERGLTLRTSIIVGFPGETEEEFGELLDFVREAEFDRLGAFAFSPEEGTPAAEMPDQLPEEVKQDRLDRLMTLQQEISLKRNRARVGTVEKVLVTDAGEDGVLLGRSQREAPETDGEIYFVPARGMQAPKPGEFVQVKITGAEEYDLTGEMTE